MIDGRGQVRITDFGLAALAAEIPLSDLRSGTPAYMSPEQKAGKEVTTRSDIYSLGLVLHEMFTGKAPQGHAVEPQRIRQGSRPRHRAPILRCLEEDPKRRPQHAAQCRDGSARSRPHRRGAGGRRNSFARNGRGLQEKEGFSSRTAMLCFAAAVVLAIAGAWVEQRTGLVARAPMPLPPEVLADRAQQLVRSIGYAEEPLLPAYGFECCDQAAIDNLARYDAARREQILASHQPPITLFWYRQNQVPPVSNSGVFPDEPAPGLVAC